VLSATLLKATAYPNASPRVEDVSGHKQFLRRTSSRLTSNLSTYFRAYRYR
jgi:hypothetical protein